MLREHTNCLDNNNLIKYCNESLLALILPSDKYEKKFPYSSASMFFMN